MKAADDLCRKIFSYLVHQYSNRIRTVADISQATFNSSRFWFETSVCLSSRLGARTVVDEISTTDMTETRCSGVVYVSLRVARNVFGFI